MANLSGGVKRGTRTLALADLEVSLDTAALGWWSNGHFLFRGIAEGGGSPSALAGDIQVLDNIDIDNAVHLLSAWYEHRFLENRLSLLVGLYNQDREFQILDYGGVFINSSFAVSPELAQVGPSIYPATAAGARLRYDADNGLYAIGTVYDGVPGDPNNPRATVISFDRGDGLMLVTELGYHVDAKPAPPAGGSAVRHIKVGMGGWFHSRTFTDYDGYLRRVNGGLYGLGEYQFSDHLGAFVMLGWGLPDRNANSGFVAAGVNVFGALPQRPQDVLGVGVTQVRNSHGFRSVNPGSLVAETAIEVTYQMPAMDHVTLQPDLQYIINPGAKLGIGAVVVVGCRLVIAY